MHVWHVACEMQALPESIAKRDSFRGHDWTRTGFRSWLIKVEDTGSKSLELRTLEWFRHVVTLHFVCWAVLHLDITILDLISHEEVLDVDVPRPLAHTLVPISFQFNRTGVVL